MYDYALIPPTQGTLPPILRDGDQTRWLFLNLGSVPAHYSGYGDDSHVDLWPGISELMLGFSIEGLGQRYFLSFRLLAKAR